MPFKQYGTNSPEAILRIFVMAKSIDRDLPKAQTELLVDMARAFEKPPEILMQLAAEYEIDVAQCKTDTTKYLLGHPNLPNPLVRAALDEVQGTDLRLRVVKKLHQVLTSPKSHSREHVYLMDLATKYWGVDEAWRTWLKT